MQTYEFNYNEYKKKSKRGKSHSLLIIAILIIVLISMCIFLNPTNATNKYYFVRINTYLTYKEANNAATELHSRSAGGYIHFDGRYHVLASFYPSKAEAEAVLSNISHLYPHADIYTLEARSLDRSTNDIILDVVACQIDTISSIYKLILELDQGQISAGQVNSTIKHISSHFSSKQADFVSFHKTTKKPNIINCANILDNISNSLENISTITPQPNLYQYKYELMNIIFNHLSFLDSL